MAVRPIPCSGGSPVQSQIFAEVGDDLYGVVGIAESESEGVNIGAVIVTPTGGAFYNLVANSLGQAFSLTLDGVEVLRLSKLPGDPPEIAFFGVGGSARPAFSNGGSDEERISNLEDALDDLGLIHLLD